MRRGRSGEKRDEEEIRENEEQGEEDEGEDQGEKDRGKLKSKTKIYPRQDRKGKGGEV